MMYNNNICLSLYILYNDKQISLVYMKVYFSLYETIYHGNVCCYYITFHIITTFICYHIGLYIVII